MAGAPHQSHNQANKEKDINQSSHKRNLKKFPYPEFRTSFKSLTVSSPLQSPSFFTLERNPGNILVLDAADGKKRVVLYESE